MIINNQQLTDQQLLDLDHLIEVAHEQDGGSPAIYKHLLVLKRDTPSNFFYYTPAIGLEPPKLLGFLSLFFFYHDSCEVCLLVHPGFRHQNIAQMLLDEALPICQLKKTKQLIFSTPHAHRPPLLDVMGAVLHHSEYHLVRDLPTVPPLASRKLNVRLAKASDIPTLCELDKQCFETEDDDMKDRFLNLLYDANYAILVAELDNQVIGKLHFRFGFQDAELSDFCVFPLHQHQGYGGEFLSSAIQYAHEQNYLTIALDVEAVTNPILKLYTLHGFAITKTIDFYLVNID